jgi:uncharacterized membrane protein YqjE
MARGDAQEDNSSPGVIGSLRGLVATVVGLAQTRLQLLANELEEQRIRVLQMVVLAAVAMFFGAMAVILITAFIVVALWDLHRLWTLGLLAALYAAGALAVLSVLKRRAAERPKAFSASVAELQRDEKALRS